MNFKLLFILLLVLANTAIFCQNPDSSKYIDVEYIKSTAPDFVTFEKNFWKPIHAQLIKEGRQNAWYLYKLKYPQGEQAKYDYIVVNVSMDWNGLVSTGSDFGTLIKNSKISLSPDALISQSNTKQIMIWKQLYRLVGQAVKNETMPSKYLIVNEVKTVAGQESEYVQMEQTYFKPFHTARAEEGIMNNWGLYKRELPYGEKFESDYVTFNGYSTWEDITKQNPPTAWKKVHGDLNFNEIHEKTIGKRSTVNVECWELVDYLIK